MRELFLPVFGLFCATALVQAELASEKQPMEITATGDTNYQDGLATAHGNVAIHTGDSDIYADSAQYNPKTHEVLAEGHVRIYRVTGLFVGDRAIYNVDTKKIQAVEMRRFFPRNRPLHVASENSCRPRFVRVERCRCG